MSSSAAAQSSGKASGGASLAVAAPHPRRTTSSELPDLLDAVPGQIGHAILRASDGTILHPPSGSLTERDIGIVYRMIMEVGTLLAGSGGEGLQRMTVAFRSVSYAVALGGGGNDDCLYIVKKRSSSP